jgi:hypothetical protein
MVRRIFENQGMTCDTQKSGVGSSSIRIIFENIEKPGYHQAGGRCMHEFGIFEKYNYTDR